MDRDFSEYFQLAHNRDIAALSLGESRSIGYTLKAMGAGIWAFTHAANYRDGLLAVINEGGDADTNGAVAGAILGAKFGFSGIPIEWTNGLLGKADLDDRVRKLLPFL